MILKCMLMIFPLVGDRILAQKVQFTGTLRKFNAINEIYGQFPFRYMYFPTSNVFIKVFLL